MREYAHFHALGMALRIKKPEFWQAAREPINSSAYDMPEEELDDVAKHTVELLCSDPGINKYEDRIRKSIMANKSVKALMAVEENEPWVSIVHGDGWVNNILFHHAKNGKVDKVKFVDYQITRMSSPLLDLPYFLCTSSNADVMDNHFDELLDVYHSRFVDVLAKVGCNVSPFTKENFIEEFNRVAKNELFHCAMALKFITMEVQQDDDLGDIKASVMLSSAEKIFFDRSWKVVSKFVEKGWI
ncbi:uncharacterized protein LOC100679280 isoform X2 [Nasonia vitripennis]|nr:uncharacterized protein LOC100679280 isoform X2 [Nasonia vitripennis]